MKQPRLLFGFLSEISPCSIFLKFCENVIGAENILVYFRLKVTELNMVWSKQTIAYKEILIFLTCLPSYFIQ